MLTDKLGAVLKSARKALGLTQQQLAARAGVSVRLWAEVERGIRPNVSLATALSMLQEVGLSLTLEDAAGSAHELRDAHSAAAARTARRKLRATVFELGAEPGDDLSSSTTVGQRLEMVDALSRRMWELSGRPVPMYSRSETPVTCIPRT